MHPVCGKDTNVNAVLQAALAAKGHTGITAKVKKVEEVYDGAGISKKEETNGDITYFYADPNTDRSVWFGSYKVTFELAKDGVTYDYADVPVILYWEPRTSQRHDGRRDSRRGNRGDHPGCKHRPSACDAESRATEGRRRQEVDTDFVDLLERAGHQHQQSEADECRHLVQPYVGVVKQAQPIKT